MPQQRRGSTIIHIRGSTGNDDKAKSQFQREFQCVECGHTVAYHPKRNEPGFGNRMVAAHCYDELHPEKVFLITTCSTCNTNGRKSGRYFTCLRSAYKEYLYDSDGNIKGKSDYLGHGKMLSRHHRRYSPQRRSRGSTQQLNSMFNKFSLN